MVTVLIIDLILSFGIPVLLILYRGEKISQGTMWFAGLLVIVLLSAKWMLFEDSIKKGKV